MCHSCDCRVFLICGLKGIERKTETEREGGREMEGRRQATVHPTPTMLRFNFRPSINLKLRLADLSWIVELVFEDLSLNVDCLLCGFL